MANFNVQLPCDHEGTCMMCKAKPQIEETLVCSACTSTWHVVCLNSPPETLGLVLEWKCPDCSDFVIPRSGSAAIEGAGKDLVRTILMIEADQSLSKSEKSRKQQQILSGKGIEKEIQNKDEDDANDGLRVLEEQLKCSICIQLPEKPVTTPCGHNYCLKCFQKLIRAKKSTCPQCRQEIPASMADQPQINPAIVAAIHMAKLKRPDSSAGPSKVYTFVQNEDKPDEAYTTERARRKGKANAASGKIFVTIPPDHFGPILAENDPKRNLGVLVGDSWKDRMECRQWGVHFPHVAGTAGQSGYGAQSVAFSGSYEDDLDNGEWFLFTGSGGKDLSGNKRTSKTQSSNQKFEKMNDALRVSCQKGYPVRVIRSKKKKDFNSSKYFPEEKGVRYDGIYRIEKCWRKIGDQGFKVCRFLFVRCDNAPAPWKARDGQGDRPRSLPFIQELDEATDVFERNESPAWDFDENEDFWKWKKPQPLSRKLFANDALPQGSRRSRKNNKSTVSTMLPKEFSCPLCEHIMSQPLCMPCGHNFCKACLDQAFAGKTLVRERSRGGRSLRSKKNILKCPSCPTDLSEYMQSAQVNRELMDVIESLKNQHVDANSDEENTNSEKSIEGEGSRESKKHKFVAEDEAGMMSNKRIENVINFNF